MSKKQSLASRIFAQCSVTDRNKNLYYSVVISGGKATFDLHKQMALKQPTVESVFEGKPEMHESLRTPLRSEDYAVLFLDTKKRYETFNLRLSKPAAKKLGTKPKVKHKQITLNETGEVTIVPED